MKTNRGNRAKTMIRFNNYAKKIGRRGNHDIYQWKIFMNEDDDTLDSIEYVLYLLHQTFPNPARIVRDRESRFALESSGWGNFTVFITIRFKNGKEEETQYGLDLSKKWPESELEEVDEGVLHRVSVSTGALKYWHLKSDPISAYPLSFNKPIDFEFLVRTATINAMVDIRNQMMSDLSPRVVLVSGNRGSGKTTAMLYLGYLLGKKESCAFLNCNTVIQLNDLDAFIQSIHTSILFSLTDWIVKTHGLECPSLVQKSHDAIKTHNINLIDGCIDNLLEYLSSFFTKKVLFIDNLDKPAAEKYKLLRDYFIYDQRFFEDLVRRGDTFTFVTLQPFICSAICSDPQTSSIAGKIIEVRPWTTSELDELLAKRLSVASMDERVELNGFFSPEARGIIYSRNEFNPRWVQLAAKKLMQKRYELNRERKSPISIGATFCRGNPEALQGAKLLFTEFDFKFELLDGLVARNYPKQFLRIRKVLRENLNIAYDLMDALVSLWYKQEKPSERIANALVESGLLVKSGKRLEVAPDIKLLLRFLEEKLPPDPDSVRYFFLSRPL